MNILFVMESFYPDLSGGGHIVAWRLCSALAAKGHSMYVVTSGGEGASKHEVINGIEIYRPFTASHSVINRVWFALRLYPYLNTFLKRKPIDIIYNHAYAVTPATILIASRHHIPAITAVHLLVGRAWFQIANPFLATLNYLTEILILRFSGCGPLVCPSNEVAKRVERHNKRRKILTIPNPLDLDEIKRIKEGTDSELVRKGLLINKGEQFLLFVGSLLKVKNVGGLIKVLSKSEVSFKLVIIGEGPERRKIEKLAKGLGLENRTLLLGHKSHRETLSIMKSCDVLVLPSKSEVFSYSVIEALSLSKPVIATKVGGISEIESENLYLIDSVAEINQLLETGITPKADDRFAEKYSVDKTIGEFENLFKGAIKAPK